MLRGITTGGRRFVTINWDATLAQLAGLHSANIIIS